MNPQKVALSLFWRTLFLLLLLLASCVAAWVQTLRTLEAEPQNVRQSARHLASLVRLSSESLHLADRAARPTLVKALGAREGMVLQSRAVADVWTTPPAADHAGELAAELRSLLGRELLVASSVNGTPGLWLGFVVDREAWWLQAPAQLARGRDFEPFDRSLDVQVSRLRKLIEPDAAQPRYIQTVWGVGYVFVPDGAA